MTDTPTSRHPDATVWRTRGFQDFRRGTCGNAGQNLYVSRAGVLQRIHLFDVNRDGYMDLLFCNAQAHQESPPAYVYADVLGRPQRRELPATGAATGAVADFNGDGFDDLLLGMQKSGMPGPFNAFLYYGAPEGLSERCKLHLPADRCTAAAAGDFDGDGRIDLALIAAGRLRLFCQNEYGFEAKRFIDLDVSADQIGAADLDGDGFADLYALPAVGAPRIYWGGPGGLDAERFVDLPFRVDANACFPQEQEMSEEERVGAVTPLARALSLNGVPHVFVPGPERTLLVPIGRDRTAGTPLAFGCRAALAGAVGDVNGDGHDDLVFVGRDRDECGERAWIYWGGPDGFSEQRRSAVPTEQACDVAVGDLDGNACADVAIAQRQDAETFSVDSLVYRGGPDGITAEPVRLPTLGARRVFIARPSGATHPQIIFVNQTGRTCTGDVDATIYLGGADGFDADRVVRLPGRGATVGDVADLDDDGWPDVVIANSAENAMHLDPGSYVFRGGPEGFGREPTQVIPTRRGWSVCAVDVDRDGYLDLVFSHFYDADIVIYRGTAGGFDVDHPQRLRVIEGPGDFIPPRRICMADLNNDGWLDLVVSPAGLDRTVVLPGGPDGWDIDRRLVLPTPGGGGVPMVRDLTGNGYADLLIGGGKAKPGIAHDSFLHIFWNGPDGLRPDRQAQLPTESVIGLAVADFNNDGYPDIFCCSYKTIRDRDIDAYLYWGGPEGYATERRMRVRAHSSSACVAADFNEDGYVDLAVANHKVFADHVGESFVFWNGPEGLDEGRFTRLPTAGPHGMYVAQPGNILDGGWREYYTSEPFELPAGAAITSIDWDVDLGPKTWVESRIRCGADRAAVERAAWHGPDGPEGWYRGGQSLAPSATTGRWVQYQLALGATNGGSTPRVTEVRLSWG